ncbi:MAG TPA: phage holin family protein [Pyrinomonadaceae bacterium]|nr:phage holin family protein [Pyrinomonadaceae bacterium]
MQRMNENRAENKPLGDLFSDLAGEMSELVRKEVTLAKLEVGQKARHIGKNIGYLVVGGAVAYAAMLAIIAGIVMLLDGVMPNWVAAIVVGVVVGIIGWLLIGKARAALQATDITPQQTVETLKEDAAWVKQQIK